MKLSLRRFCLLLVSFSLPFFFAGVTRADEAAKKELQNVLKGVEGKGKLYATFKTSLGDIHCELFEEKAPKTVANFVGLARGTKEWIDPKSKQKVNGKSLYAGTIFHRVIPDFMIQGGDPLGVGVGGPGYKFEDEFHPTLRHDKPGILFMANSGPNTNGSQFFITETPTAHLDNKHSVFGSCQDIELVKKIARVPAPRSKPDTDVVIKEIVITRGAAAK
jgi:peptidyl-prolyl cis-trans isomerase A (cyclophilin A)